ncbi:MAG: LysR family transcriptional regulator [Ectothiorhodospiraceae bacterium]|nr:LysR family transcriptional regulator [Ectothiorhodospiraceae bacterium]MCH8503800.1 LysR family transcriptional regulator [Ectothiorhodospiraceae bacterium]
MKAQTIPNYPYAPVEATASVDTQDCPVRYPPIQTLKAFEAVARLKSFTRAAAELYLTQSAVTHQIRRFEEYLDARLFHRHSSGVELTEVGQAIYRDITVGLFIIGRSLTEARRHAA